MNTKTVRVAISVIFGVLLTIAFYIGLEFLTRPLMRQLFPQSSLIGPDHFANWSEWVVRLFLFGVVPSFFGTYVSGAFTSHDKRTSRFVTGGLLVFLFPIAQIAGVGLSIAQDMLNWIELLLPLGVSAFVGATIAWILAKDIQRLSISKKA